MSQSSQCSEPAWEGGPGSKLELISMKAVDRKLSFKEFRVLNNLKGYLVHNHFGTLSLDPFYLEINGLD